MHKLSIQLSDKDGYNYDLVDDKKKKIIHSWKRWEMARKWIDGYVPGNGKNFMRFVDKNGSAKLKVDPKKFVIPFREGMEQYSKLVSEVDVTLPAEVKRFMGKFVAALNKSGLNRKRQIAVLSGVIDAMNIEPGKLMAMIKKVKKNQSVDEGPQRDRNGLAMYIIDLNNMLANAKILLKRKDPNAKKYIKLIQQDIKDAEEKLAKI